MHDGPAAQPASSPATLAIALAACAAGVLGLAALWTVLNLQTGGLNGWATLVAAADAALLLRLAGMAAGPVRATLGCAAALLTAALVGFLTAATRIGVVMGLRPLESAERMSAGLALALLESAARPWDWAGLLLGLALAWWLCR